MVKQKLARIVRMIPARTRLGIIGVLVVLLGWGAFGTLAAPTRISSDLKETIAERPEGYVDIDIYFREGPTRFHLTRYQQYGQLGSVADGRLLLRRVEPRAVRQIARDYWIHWIDVSSR